MSCSREKNEGKRRYEGEEVRAVEGKEEQGMDKEEDMKNIDSWSENEEEELSSDFDPEMEVNVDFEVKPISESNGPAIQRLLKQLLLVGRVDVPGLTQLLLAQDGIGSVIQVESEQEGDGEKEEEEGGEGSGAVSGSTERDHVDEDDGEEDDDEEEVCGVTSVLNLTYHRANNKPVQSLTEHILSQCKRHSPATYPRLSTLLAPIATETDDRARHVGLLVNERYLNIPPHVAPPLLKTLLSEIEEASKKGLPYRFENYLLLARSYHVPSPLGSPPSAKRRRRGDEEEEEAEEKRRHEERENGEGSQTCVLHNQEYEEMREEAELTFTYPVSGSESDGKADEVFGGGWSFDDEPLQQTRTVMVLSSSKLCSIVDRLSPLMS